MKQLFHAIKTAQGLYPRLFSHWVSNEFGTLFYNQNNTLSVEANHGVILNPLEDYKAAMKACLDFYTPKNLPARLYGYLPKTEKEKFILAAKETGGTVAESPLKLLTCSNPQKRTNYSPLTFVEVKEWDPLITRHILGEHLQLEGSLKASLNHDTFTLTVGYMMGLPVTMASIWDDGQVMRISNVMTGEHFRGCGFAFSLMLYQLNLAALAQKPVYLFADNPVAIRLYERVGMTVEQPDFTLFIWENTENI